VQSGRLNLTAARRAAGRVKRRVIAARKPARPVLKPRLLDVGDRLVPSPVFMYSSERSGSTLLRMILDSHSQICAPHELHLRTIKIGFNSWYGETALGKFDITSEDLKDLLWDRIYHLLLTRAGKTVVVDKTPNNLFAWERIAQSWPNARYIFLRRHPLRMVESLAAASPKLEMQDHYERVNRYINAWGKARAVLPGPTISYEELTADPRRTVRRLCADIGVPFEPAMLDYGSREHSGDYRRGLGDWNAKIKSGVIHAAEPLPEPGDVPDELREACAILGYL
jgi:hypothetical protein